MHCKHFKMRHIPTVVALWTFEHMQLKQQVVLKKPIEAFFCTTISENWHTFLFSFWYYCITLLLCMSGTLAKKRIWSRSFEYGHLGFLKEHENNIEMYHTLIKTQTLWFHSKIGLSNTFKFTKGFLWGCTFTNENLDFVDFSSPFHCGLSRQLNSLHSMPDFRTAI